MRNALTQLLILLSISFVVISRTQAMEWGFFAHRMINRNAVFLLPEEIFPFFRLNIISLVNQAVIPDQKRYINALEGPMHYIDLDAYDSIPITKWREDPLYFDSLQSETWISHGALPHRLLSKSAALTRAFMEHNAVKCIQIAGDLAHYIGDAHVPLHTTSNYDGQETGQEGIHGLWESRIPELYHERYDLRGRKARYIPDLNRFFWAIIDQSHAAVDTVITVEKELAANSRREIKGFLNRGDAIMADYSPRFIEKYERGMNGMVERRLRLAIVHTADVWYTCWVNAGQPDLSDWEIENHGDQ